MESETKISLYCRERMTSVLKARNGLVELKFHVGERPFTDADYHLRSQWGTLTREIDPAEPAPQDLGIRKNMIEPLEGEALTYEATGGTAAKERLANYAGAEHLVWRGAQPGSLFDLDYVFLIKP